MPILGGLKLFDLCKCLLVNGASISVSSGASTKDYAIDKNPLSFWRSVGSNDATTETLTVTFGSVELNRILLLDHNFKGFNIQYWNGAAFVHFAGVSGLDGAMANITETAFADDTAYYEFTPVTTTQLRIQVTTTQIANAQKYLNQVFASTELGTLVGYPKIKDAVHSRGERKKEMLSGKWLVIKSIENFETELDFSDYPPSLTADLNLMVSMFEREEPFMIWLCGGRRGAAYFKYTLRGWRLRDLYSVGIVADYKMGYRKNTYTGVVDFQVRLREHV